MKLTTLNLYGRFNNWDERRQKISDYLTKQNPDIAFFQEVIYQPEESPFTQVTELNQVLLYPYEHIAVTRLQTSEHYSEYREGQGIISKYPIVKSETLVLRKNPEDHLQRIVQLVDVDFNGSIVKFANIQFAELPRHAGEHFSELLEILRSRSEKRIIIGDFNIPDIDIPMFKSLWENEYKSSTSETYISYPSMRTRVDYILIPNENTFTDINLSDEQIYLSDHKALNADVQIN